MSKPTRAQQIAREVLLLEPQFRRCLVIDYAPYLWPDFFRIHVPGALCEGQGLEIIERHGMEQFSERVLVPNVENLKHYFVEGGSIPAPGPEATWYLLELADG